MSEIKAWLLTGSRIFADRVVMTEEHANRVLDERYERYETGSKKIPLIAAADLAAAHQLIREMRDALELASSELRYYCEQDNGDIYNNPRINSAIAKANALLGETDKEN